jgi:DNA-binding LacI/PurR family transcriptional regulator
VFAKELGVGQVTLRSAFKQLEKDGLLARIHGKGTFVRSAASLMHKSILAVFPPREGVESQNHEILPGVEQRCLEKGVKLIKCSNLFLADMSLKNVRIFADEYDGIIFMENGILGNEKDFQVVKACGLPTIIPHASIGDYQISGFACLQPNESEAFATGIKYLSDKGHAKIALLLNDHPKSRGLSIDDHRRVLASLGVDDNPAFIVSSPYDGESISERIKTMMSMVDPPTAIICFSDFFAIHVYRALREMNLEIPNHVAVLGYCGFPGGEFLDPPLSTIDLGFHEVGRLSVDILLRSEEWWGAGKAPPRVFTPYRIVERASTRIERFEKTII